MRITMLPQPQPKYFKRRMSRKDVKEGCLLHVLSNPKVIGYITFMLFLLTLFVCCSMYRTIGTLEGKMDAMEDTLKSMVSEIKRQNQISGSQAFMNDLGNGHGSHGFFNINDDINVAVHHNMTPEQRLRWLELKVNSANNWSKDPTFGLSETTDCKESTNLYEYADLVTGPDANNEGFYEHMICLDNFSSPATDGQDCLIYDFGVRQQPHFGQIMATHFGCEVHAFDPSPISVDWYEGLEADHPLKAMDNYHFHDYGISGHDGTVDLYTYQWRQVSTIKLRDFTWDCGEPDSEGELCRQIKRGDQGSYPLKVKTMKTIREELGHENRDIDILKIDVEGSEYGFLYSMFDDYMCPDFVKQLALEWHHYTIDVRYGEGSSPYINQLATMLHACGLESFWVKHPTGWFATNKYYVELKMENMRYNLQSFRRPTQSK